MKIRFAHAWFLLVLGVSLGAPAATAKSAFYEGTVINDSGGDFPGNGALDIVSVHVGEKFSFDLDDKTGVDVIDFRVEVRVLSEMQNVGNQAVRYDLHFKANGAAKNTSVTATWAVPVTGGTSKPEIRGSGFSTADSIVLRLESGAIPIAPGSLLTNVWASTSLVSGDSSVHQDLAPYDNKNAPAPPAAEANPSAAYTVSGPYPFLRVEPTSALLQYSVGGSEVSFSFRFTLAEGISGDRIVVLFPALPRGWEITPSHGTTGPPPEGQISNANGGTPFEFSFSAKNQQSPAVGDRVPFIMEASTLSGGHVLVNAVVSVTGAKIARDDYLFSLKTPGPFKEGGASVLTVGVTHGVTGPLTSEEVSADFLHEGALRATVVATAKGSGVYDLPYTFPTAGDWTVDAYVSELAPSPHEAFVVHVEKKGGLAPGPAFLWLGMGLLAAAGLRRD